MYIYPSCNVKRSSSTEDHAPSSGFSQKLPRSSKYKEVIFSYLINRDVTSRTLRYNRYLYFGVQILITTISFIIFSNDRILNVI